MNKTTKTVGWTLIGLLVAVVVFVALAICCCFDDDLE